MWTLRRNRTVFRWLRRDLMLLRLRKSWLRLCWRMFLQKVGLRYYAAVELVLVLPMPAQTFALALETL
jgi:hypothetical protein